MRNTALSWQRRENGEISVVVPRREDLVGKLLSTIFLVPKKREIILDQVGADI